MAAGLRRVLFLLFFVSGFCGLLYQVVWLRLAYASFGIIMPIMSALISVFMFGLALGSKLGGAYIESLTRKTGLSGIYFYAAAELFLGIMALLVPLLFSLSERILFGTGEIDSLRYLLMSSLLMSLSILPSCLLMGATFPLMMAFVKEQAGAEKESFSYLYLGNVMGAATGTLLTAFVLIELLGFRTTAALAASLNIGIAITCLVIGRTRQRDLPEPPAARPVLTVPSSGSGSQLLPLFILFLTGLTSMSMEVVWIRASMPIVGTQIYSFAYILAVYLLATMGGSYYYRSRLRSGADDSGKVVALMSSAALFPLLMNHPTALELLQKHVHPSSAIIASLLSIAPICALWGYLTPKLIDQYSAGEPDRAGAAYALNILGCIIGPLLASYILLPYAGIKYSILALTCPYLLLSIYFLSLSNQKRKWSWGLNALAALLLIMSISFGVSYEEYYRSVDPGSVVRRDHTATVVATGKGAKKKLLINGVGTTQVTAITKFMAHLPLSLLSKPPESALVICFGMGTTYRSLLEWDIDVTAVELVPSVRDAFGYYHKDADMVMKNPKGRIVIDDGRRFLKRTDKKFDVITIDPPPPVEAAGSSLLLSEEFYAIARQHLNKGGILHQWFPHGEDRILFATARSLVNSFRFVKAYRSVEGWGVHLIASDKELIGISPAKMVSVMPPKAAADILESYPGKDLREVVGTVVERAVPMRRLLDRDRSVVITDDRPFNEYYMLRRMRARMNNTYRYVQYRDGLPQGVANRQVGLRSDLRAERDLPLHYSGKFFERLSGFVRRTGSSLPYATANLILVDNLP
ncbi:MAG: fused MFS/spermidine synthase [Thermodesulfovibrionales bacterium]